MCRYHKHGPAGIAHHLFGSAAHEQMPEASAAVSGSDNQINISFLGEGADLRNRGRHCDHGFEWNPSELGERDKFLHLVFGIPVRRFLQSGEIVHRKAIGGEGVAERDGVKDDQPRSHSLGKFDRIFERLE